MTRRPTTAAWGFTLFEAMFTAAILALALAIVIPTAASIGAARKKTAAGTLAAEIRYLYSKARLEGLYFRITFDLDKNSYRVESTTDPVRFPTQTQEVSEGVLQEIEEEEEDEPLFGEFSHDILAQEGSGSMLEWTGWGDYKSALEKKVARFTAVNERLLEEKELPPGIVFAGVFTARQTDIAFRGLAYLYIFPHGFVEPAVIYLADDPGEGFDAAGLPDEEVMSLRTSPLTGGVRVYDRRIEKPDFAAEARDEDEF